MSDSLGIVGKLFKKKPGQCKSGNPDGMGPIRAAAAFGLELLTASLLGLSIGVDLRDNTPLSALPDTKQSRRTDTNKKIQYVIDDR